MDIDGVHVNKKPRPPQNIEVQTKSDVDCMIVDSVSESVTQVPSFKVEHLPSTIVLKGEKKHKLGINMSNRQSLI